MGGLWLTAPWSNDGPSDVQLASDLVAVIPFTVRGSPDLAYLGEGIVDLMSAKLGGAGSLTAVNPRVMIALVARVGTDVSDPAGVRALAKEARAGLYVTGDILEVGGRVRLSAFLYDTRRPDAPLRQASAEGQPDELFEVIDGLAAELLAGVLEESVDRLESLATVTSASLPAAKAFLEGERLLRAGRYRDAGTAYDEAVALDTAFALAYYRKSIAADWIDAYDVRSSADRAMEFAGQLSPRDRSLLAALKLRRHGRNSEAEQAYRAHLHQYPDEVEALVQLGEVLFHDNPRRGRPIFEAMEPFRHAAELEPANLIAQVHLARLLSLADSSVALRQTAAFLAEVASQSERAFEVEAMYAWESGDAAQQQRVITQIQGQPWFARWYAVHAIARFVRDPAGAAELLSGHERDALLLEMLVPTLQVARGQIGEFRAFLANAQGRGSPTWDLFEAFAVTSGAYEATDHDLTALLNRLDGATPAAILSTALVPPYEDLSPAFAAFERDYFRAMLLIELGRVGEAREILSTFADVPAFPGLGTLQQDAVHGLEAEILYRSGRLEDALDRIRLVEQEVPHAGTVRAVVDGARLRFLRAELEFEVGDVAVAKNYFLGLDESWSYWDTFYRPHAYRRLAEIAESEGRVDDAILWYGRLVEAWRDCDDALVPRREEIDARRRALLGRR
jgi:tetratricopeptide (TPR) repeat protein